MTPAPNASDLIDPRGSTGVEPLAPAQRPTTLEGRRVLLVNNGKLAAQYGVYAVLWEVVKAAHPATTWLAFMDDLLTYSDPDLEQLADRLIAQQRPDAVVLALADAGVSFQTTVLSLALERRGVPTALIATDLGARFVRGIYAMLAPGLDPIALATVRTDSAQAVRTLMESALPELAARLTSAQRAAHATGHDLHFPSANGACGWSDAADAMLAFQDWAEGSGLGDGLPLVPPTKRAIDAYLRTVKEDPDTTLLGPAITSGRMVRIRDAAANAAMTACPPQAFPVIVSALRAMSHPDYRVNQTVITTHPAGNAVIYSGPDPGRYGLSGGPGCLGPGHRGNASTGRAVALTLSSVYGARPGGVDLTTFGSPAEFTYCLAEAVDASPWPSLADELNGGRPMVMTLKIESPRNVLEHLTMTPKGLIEALAGTATGVGSNNSYWPGDLLVLINPEHARIFRDAGWTRDDVAYGIFHAARISRAKIEGHGVAPNRPKYMDLLDDLPIVRTVRDIHIIVAGAPAPQSMVALPWGFSCGQWQPVAT